MNYLITPIKLSDDALHCVDSTTKRTEVVLDGDASATMTGWMLYETPDITPSGSIASDDNAQSDRVYEGFIEFGVTCGTTSVVIDYEGRVETKNNDFDKLQFYLNGVLLDQVGSTRVEYTEGVGTFDEGGGVWTKPYEGRDLEDSYTITIPSERPCGNIIKILASTGDTVANNNLYWFVSIASIS